MLIRRYSFAGTDIVTLIIGENKQKFHIHDEKLFSASPIFKQAFKEAGSNRILEVPDGDVVLFDSFIHWLYSSKLKVPTFAPNQQENGTVMFAVRLYVMAHQFKIVNLKNDICTLLFLVVPKANFQAPPRCAVLLAYRQTPSKSPIRRLLVDWLVYNTHTNWFKVPGNQAWLVSLPRFAVDIAVGFSQGGACDAEDGPFGKGNVDFYAETASAVSSQQAIVID